MANSKYWKDCGEHRPLEEFWRDKRRTDGLAFYCKVHARRRWYKSRERHAGAPKHRFSREVAVPDGFKWCPDCTEVKPLDEFPKTRATVSGYYTYCKPCHNVRGKASKEKIGGSRTYHLKRRYGITAEDADAMLEAQGGMCAICRVEPAAHVDHDHATGAVRQLLCFNCNGGLGQFKDDPEVLRAAADYVERHQDAQMADGEPAVARPGRDSDHRRRVRARIEALFLHPTPRVPQPLPPGLQLDD